MTDNNKIANEEQLENVSGGITEGEMRVQQHYLEQQEFIRKRAEEEAERREWEQQEQIRRYKEQQERMRQGWGR